MPITSKAARRLEERGLASNLEAAEQIAERIRRRELGDLDPQFLHEVLNGLLADDRMDLPMNFGPRLSGPAARYGLRLIAEAVMPVPRRGRQRMERGFWEGYIRQIDKQLTPDVLLFWNADKQARADAGRDERRGQFFEERSHEARRREHLRLAIKREKPALSAEKVTLHVSDLENLGAAIRRRLGRDDPGSLTVNALKRRLGFLSARSLQPSRSRPTKRPRKSRV